MINKTKNYDIKTQNVFLLSFLFGILFNIFLVHYQNINKLEGIGERYSLVLITLFMYCICVYKIFTLKKNVCCNIIDVFVLLYTIYYLFRFLKSDYIDFESIPYICCWAVYPIIRTIKFEYIKRNIIIIYGFILFFINVQIIVCILQFLNITNSFNKNFIMTGSFKNPGPLCIYLISYLMIILLFSKKKNNCRYLKYTSIITVLLILTILLILLSRASLIGSLVGLSLFCLILNWNLSECKTFISNHWKSICIIGLTITLLIYGLIIIKYDSAMGRILSWKIGYQMFWERPIFGYGVGSVRNNILKHQAKYFDNNHFNEHEISLAGKIEYIYNDILQLGVELGGIGLFLFLSIILSMIYSLRIEQHKDKFLQYFKIVLFCCIISVFTSCIFSYGFEVFSILVNVIILISLFSSVSDSPLYKFIVPGYIGLIFFVVVSIVVNVFTIDFSRQTDITNSIVKISDSNLSDERKIDIYRNIEYGELPNKYLLMNLGKSLSNNGDFYESNIILLEACSLTTDPFLYSTIGFNYQHLESFELAEKYYKESYKMIPNRLYPLYLLFQLYIKSNNFSKADQVAKEILNFPIKVESSATRQILSEIEIYINSNPK